MRILIRQAKGNKDRYSLLAENNLQLLRKYWKVYRPHSWLFPGSIGTKPISVRSIQEAFAKSLRASGISKKTSLHTLRHCFATHLLNHGKADILEIKTLDIPISKRLPFICISRIPKSLASKVLLIFRIEARRLIELQHIFARFADPYLASHPVHLEGIKAARAIKSCRTLALGAHIDQFDSCEDMKVSYNLCRNRNCPKCGNLKKEQWILDRTSDLLPVPYFHTVFTVPHELNPLVSSEP